jgi:pimeloyl-ACP methyl ester carboxylesterase
MSAAIFLGCDSYTIASKRWDYKGHSVAYEEFIPECKDRTESSEPVLILNGFGVGSFHQHRLISHLMQRNPRPLPFVNEVVPRAVYGLDYLGQGKSWPRNCDDGNSVAERGLRYCIYTWADQVASFIEEVILPSAGAKVHIVGNSLGGHLAVILALRPNMHNLIGSIVLLNATPVWGLDLPFWTGHLPPPPLPRSIGRYLFDLIRDKITIEKYLDAAYANSRAFDEELIQQIKSCTDGRGGHAAFASILWSPPAKFPEIGATGFTSMLSKTQCDVLLIFGQKDPWCKPVFGRHMMKALQDRKNCAASQRYVELDNVGHCPNHEAPKAVAKILQRWLSSLDRRSLVLVKDAAVDKEDSVTTEAWGTIKMREVKDDELHTTLLHERIIVKMIAG